MPEKKLFITSDFNFTYPANDLDEDNWNLRPGPDWNVEFQEVALADVISPGSSVAMHKEQDHTNFAGFDRTAFSPQPNEFLEVQYAWSMGVVNASENGTNNISNQILFQTMQSAVSEDNVVKFIITDMFLWHDNAPSKSSPTIKITDFPETTVYWKKENSALIALPTAGTHTWNGIKFRIQRGEIPRVWINPNLAGIWIEITDPGTSQTYNEPAYNFTRFNYRFRGVVAGLKNVIESGLDLMRVYTSVIDNENIVLGMSDADGNTIIGVDDDDDGSGDVSGGGSGLGGGGDGGISGGGLVGSGSDGNVAGGGDLPNDSGASAWRGSGTGIDITKWNFTKVMDGFGFGEIDLHMVDSWERALNTFRSRNFTIGERNGGVLFRGSILDVEVIEDYRGRLILEETHAALQRRETKTNFQSIINADGSGFDTVFSFTADVIKIKNGAIAGSITTDSKYAVMVVPGADVIANNENFDNLVTGGASGDIADVNTDNDDFVFLNTDATGDALEIEGSYSGTRADLQALEIKIKTSLADISGDVQTAHIDMYDYAGVAWVNDVTEAYEFAPGWGFGNTPIATFESKKGIDTTLTSNVQRFIGTAGADTDKFKLRVRITYAGDHTFTSIRIYYADMNAFENPIYIGNSFPIIGKTAFVFTVSGNPVTSGLRVNDTVVVGRRNDLVLADLASEWFSHYNVEVDSGFVGYTASNFLQNHMTNWDAIRSVLKKDEGIMYYRADTNTLIFKKRDNLDDSSVTISDRATDPVRGNFLSQQSKFADEYFEIQITGAAYKTYDSEINVKHSSGQIGPEGNLVLRINDPNLNTLTEAIERTKSEFNLMQLNKEPIHAIELSPTILDISSLYPGKLFTIKRRGKTSTAPIPLRMINVNFNGYNDVSVITDFGWKGTSAIDREIEAENEKRRLIRASYKGMVTRPQGNLIGNEILSHGHAGFTNIQETETITTVAAGSTVNTSHKTHTKYGMQITPNDNTGTFTSATVDLEISLDGESTWTTILTFTLNVASAYSDFTNIDNQHSIDSDNDWSYSSGTDLLTDTIDIRYNVTAISLVGDADIDIILLKSR